MSWMNDVEQGWPDPLNDTKFRRLLSAMRAYPYGATTVEWDAEVRRAGYANRGQVWHAVGSNAGQRKVFALIEGRYYLDIPGHAWLARLWEQRLDRASA